MSTRNNRLSIVTMRLSIVTMRLSISLVNIFIIYNIVIVELFKHPLVKANNAFFSL
ncbi:hypothetical protein [Marinifilum caeruleilacunae]|uniref:hypothetical protein n=1 Tax=Marinifilum caeruleilacunae TaxID=2499076 RepID=UPI00149325A9|nr:hypothetical protein [Marinifilum caeruleilacunae]